MIWVDSRPDDDELTTTLEKLGLGVPKTRWHGSLTAVELEMGVQIVLSLYGAEDLDARGAGRHFEPNGHRDPVGAMVTLVRHRGGTMGAHLTVVKRARARVL